MTSPIKAVIDEIHSELAELSNSPARATSPYYRYGEVTYDTNEGVPPQVRWRKSNGTFGPKLKGGGKQINDELASSGSIANFQQNLQCKVWGEDEESTLSEFFGLCQAIEKVRSNNSQLVTQPTVIERTFNWLELSGDNGILGCAIEFDYEIYVNLPHVPVTMVEILTASLSVTGSSGINSLPTFESGTLEPIFGQAIFTE